MIDTHNSQFRCPFQIKGEKEGTIVEVTLNDDADTRIKLISAAFKYFHETPNTLSLRFHLPESLKAQCSSNEELKILILPHQSEILACELEYRLGPFLPYQMAGYTREELLPVFEQYKYKFATAYLLNELMKSHGFPMKSVTDISAWILWCMLNGARAGAKSTQLQIKDEDEKVLLTISPGSAYFHPEDYEELTGPGKANRNCFGIVTSPFYPVPFGRYSQGIQIVMSRMKDFLELSSEQRRKIRYKCNLVYQQHGVAINDLEEDKQPEGLWIPEYVAVQT